MSRTHYGWGHLVSVQLELIEDNTAVSVLTFARNRMGSLPDTCKNVIVVTCHTGYRNHTGLVNKGGHLRSGGDVSSDVSSHVSTMRTTIPMPVKDAVKPVYTVGQ